MRPTLKSKMYKALHKSKFFLIEKWIDIKYSVLEWIYLKTAKLRIKYSKKLIISSHAYVNYDYKMTWDDVDVSDQWGHWLPLSFGICSKESWEWDNQINKECGISEEPWKDVVESENWTTYYTKDDYLNSNHYFIFARKHLSKILKEQFNNKEIELKLLFSSQDTINEDLHRQTEWIKAGKPKFKVEFADGAKDDFKQLLGEEEAEKLFKEQEEQNLQIMEDENIKKAKEYLKKKENDEGNN